MDQSVVGNEHTMDRLPVWAMLISQDRTYVLIGKQPSDEPAHDNEDEQQYFDFATPEDRHPKQWVRLLHRGLDMTEDDPLFTCERLAETLRRALLRADRLVEVRILIPIRRTLDFFTAGELAEEVKRRLRCVELARLCFIDAFGLARRHWRPAEDVAVGLDIGGLLTLQTTGPELEPELLRIDDGREAAALLRGYPGARVFDRRSVSDLLGAACLRDMSIGIIRTRRGIAYCIVEWGNATYRWIDSCCGDTAVVPTPDYWVPCVRRVIMREHLRGHRINMSIGRCDGRGFVHWNQTSRDIEARCAEARLMVRYVDLGCVLMHATPTNIRKVVLDMGHARSCFHRECDNDPRWTRVQCWAREPKRLVSSAGSADQLVVRAGSDDSTNRMSMRRLARHLACYEAKPQRDSPLVRHRTCWIASRDLPDMRPINGMIQDLRIKSVGMADATPDSAGFLWDCARSCDVLVQVVYDAAAARRATDIALNLSSSDTSEQPSTEPADDLIPDDASDVSWNEDDREAEAMLLSVMNPPRPTQHPSAAAQQAARLAATVADAAAQEAWAMVCISIAHASSKKRTIGAISTTCCDTDDKENGELTNGKLTNGELTKRRRRPVDTKRRSADAKRHADALSALRRLRVSLPAHQYPYRCAVLRYRATRVTATVGFVDREVPVLSDEPVHKISGFRSAVDQFSFLWGHEDASEPDIRRLIRRQMHRASTDHHVTCVVPRFWHGLNRVPKGSLVQYSRERAIIISGKELRRVYEPVVRRILRLVECLVTEHAIDCIVIPQSHAPSTGLRDKLRMRDRPRCLEFAPGIVASIREVTDRLGVRLYHLTPNSKPTIRTDKQPLMDVTNRLPWV